MLGAHAKDMLPSSLPPRAGPCMTLDCQAWFPGKNPGHTSKFTDVIEVVFPQGLRVSPWCSHVIQPASEPP